MMDPVEKRVLAQLRSRIVEEVVATESFLCAFCDNNVLDEQMAKLLRTETNYEQRVSRLLDLLPHRGPKAFSTLMEILEVTNPWLAEKMKAALHEERGKDAKINAYHHNNGHSSLSLDASLVGHSHYRIQIDPDIKERAATFVRAHLYHLTEVEQKTLDKWLAEELQKERRRQQYRTSNSVGRQMQDFHATKDTQTETRNVDLVELYEDMMMYLHGSNYVEMTKDFSFEHLHQKVKSLLRRTQKLDAMFVNCIEKFDDADKYSAPLSELIDRVVTRDKLQVKSTTVEQEYIQRITRERDAAMMQVSRLEDEVDKLIQKHDDFLKNHDVRLKPRSRRLSSSATGKNRAHPCVRKELSSLGKPNSKMNDSSQQAKYGNKESSTDNANTNLTHTSTMQIMHGSEKKDVTAIQRRKAKTVNDIVLSDYDTISLDNNELASDEVTVNDEGHLDNDEPRSASGDKQALPTIVDNDNEDDGDLDHKSQSKPICENGESSQNNFQAPNDKIRRHASEESLRIIVSKEEAQITSVSSLKLTPPPDNSGRRKSYDPAQPDTNDGTIISPIISDPKKIEINSTDNTQRKSRSITSNSMQGARRSESERPAGIYRNQNNQWRRQGISPLRRGNSNLRRSHENLVSSNGNATSDMHNGQHFHPFPKPFLASSGEYFPHEKQALLFESSLKGCYHPGQQMEQHRPLHYPVQHYTAERQLSITGHNDDRAEISRLQNKQRLGRYQTRGSYGTSPHTPQTRRQSPSPQRQGKGEPNDFKSQGHTSDSDGLRKSTERGATGYQDFARNRVTFASPVSRTKKPLIKK